MSKEVDILEIDAEIKESFIQEKKNLEKYEENLKDLKKTLKSNFLARARNDLEKNIALLEFKINSIKSLSEYNFYIIKTAPLIEEYKKILKTPIKVSFVGKKTDKNEEKIKIIQEYCQYAQKYRNIPILEKKEVAKKIECTNCGNTKTFDIEEEVYICEECGSQKEIQQNSSSYKDSDRINIAVKYTYDRRVHFKDCINQYQGKQNSTIDQKVYDALEDQFKKHGLLCDPPEKFKNITKDHISIFLKDLGYTKHYENINLIHYNLTGIKPDDISHLEDALLNDFDLLTETYDRIFKNKIERTNFINTQNLLYQLLRRHKHPCKREDFVLLKTIDRQNFHDEVSGILFQELGWSQCLLYR